MRSGVILPQREIGSDSATIRAYAETGANLAFAIFSPTITFSARTPQTGPTGPVIRARRSFTSRLCSLGSSPPSSLRWSL